MDRSWGMRIAVAGATGNVGARTTSMLQREGHELIRISRSDGVDLITGQGLDAALEGVEAVVDAISSPPV
ncbi:MAG TPA: NmrA family transcriptional regulator, partial [Mycobacterium sp.]|nr:NmrA family transcriptional regulator [Mycobacterium sp.]